MNKAFGPLSLILGFGGSFLAKKIFERIWALIDDQEPPQPEQRQIGWPKLIGALAIEGIVFRVVKGAVDHGSRQLYAHYTGDWPGEEESEEK
ncbi:MAG TPA: DUF4235 domain-containing protein [Solirubrobacterales bacterium]|nr:DUF4235 domain-containing protein [Solirubrobacterales bacterium]